MKKLLVTAFVILSCLSSVFAQVTLNETKVTRENYENLAKRFAPEDFKDMCSRHVVADSDIYAMTNDFELVKTLGHNAGAYRFLYASLKQKKEMASANGGNLDLQAEVFNAQKLFYQTVEDLNALLQETYKDQAEYVQYVFSDSVNSAELALFNEAKDSIAEGLIVIETYEDVPVYSLNEIISDFKSNEIAAREKWVGKQVKMSASIYSIYQLDYNSVFNITSEERNVVPVMRLNSGNQAYANCFFNNENVGKIARYKKNKQVTVVGVICQDIARRPTFKNCKIVEK